MWHLLILPEYLIPVRENERGRFINHQMVRERRNYGEKKKDDD